MENKLRNFVLFLFSIFLCQFISAKEGMTFYNSFDRMSVNAEKGAFPKCLKWNNPGLELRAFPGIRGKGNSVALSDRESLTYECKGNLQGNCGTVSFWFAPQEDIPEKYTHCYMSLPLKGGFLALQQSPSYKNKLILTFFIPRKKDIPARTLVAYHDVPAGTLKKGIWHKVDICWDKEKISFYFDGALRRIKKSEHWLKKSPSVLLLSENTDLSVVEGKHISFNGQITGKKPVAGYLTAYDEIAFYNRSLTADEVRKDYAKYFSSSFAKEVRNPFFVLSRADVSVALDGKIVKDEWKDAVVFPLNKSKNPLEIVNSIHASCALKYDEKNLYAAFTVPRKPEKRKCTTKDGAVYEDDCFELHLFDPVKNKQYQFVVNSNGVLYDSRLSDPVPVKWNSKAECASFTGKDFWSAELCIPLADLGNPMKNAKWKMNAAASIYRSGKNEYNMFSSSILGFSYIPSMADFVWGSMTLPFALGETKVDESGLFSSSFSGAVGINGKAAITSESEEAALFPFDFNGRSWKISKKPGLHIFQTEAQYKGKKVFQYDFLYQVKRPVEFEYAFFPEEKNVHIKMSVYYTESSFVKQMKGQGIPAKVSFVSENGKVYASKNISVKDFQSSHVLSLPVEKLTEGNYYFRVEFLHEKYKFSVQNLFRVPDLSFLKEKPVMVDHTVPVPWEEIKKVGKKSYKIWDRVYHFGNGPWPVQITSRGKKLFHTSPEIRADRGGRFVWKDFKEKKSFPDKVYFSGKGENDLFAVNWTGELAFDGMYLLSWEITPKKDSVNIRNLSLTWSSPAFMGKYVTNPVFRSWRGKDEMALRFDPTNEAEMILWHSGDVHGISFFCTSDANWVNFHQEKQILLAKNKEKIDVKINVISREAELKKGKKAQYKMTLIATPARKRPEIFRSFYYETLTKATYGLTTGWGSYTATRLWADDTNFWTSNIPRDPAGYEKLIKNWWKKHKIKCFAYAMPTHLAEPEAEYDYFYPQNATLPGFFWRGTSKIDGKPYYTKPCCPGTAVGDLMLWRLEKMLTRLPELGGLYHDICVQRPCSNAAHGCGGVDVFGKSYTSVNGLHLRSYLMRVYKLTRKLNMKMMNHGHDKFNPVVHSFGDAWLPGEEILPSEIATDPGHFYCRSRSQEEYKFRFNSEVHGMGINLLVRGYSPGMYPTQKPYKHLLTGEPYFRQYTTPAVLFDFIAKCTMNTTDLQGKLWQIRNDLDFNHADFIPYWREKLVTSGSKEVYISLYRWKKPSPYPFVFAIGNLSKKDAVLDLRIDFNALKLDAAKVRFYDLWNDGKELTLPELNRSIIQSPGFRLIGVK